MTGKYKGQRYIPTHVVPDKTVPIRYRLCAGWLVFDTKMPLARHRLCLTRVECEAVCDRLNAAPVTT